MRPSHTGVVRLCHLLRHRCSPLSPLVSGLLGFLEWLGSIAEQEVGKV